MRERLSLWLFTGAVFVLLMGSTRPIPGGDGVPHRYLPLSVLCEGDLDLDELPFTKLPGGETAPRPYYLARGPDGHLWSTFGPWTGLLATPVFAAAKLASPVFSYARVLWLAKLAACAMSAAAAGLLARALRPRVGLRAAMGLALVYAFATSVWSVMSPSLWQHTAAAPFLAAGLGALTREDGRCGRAGLWFGLATLCRPSNLLLAGAAAGFVALHRRARLPGLVAWALPPALLLLAYGWLAFGDPLTLGQLEVAQDIARYKRSGAVWETGPAAVLVRALGLLLSPSRGLLVFSPVLILGLAGLLGALRRGGDPLSRWMLLGAAAVLGVHAMRFDWWGGWSYGYRQLLDVLPALMLGLAALWPRLRAPGALRGLFGAALLFSVYVQLVGVVAYDVVSWNAEPDLDQHPERLWSIPDSQLVHYLTDPRPRPLPQLYEFPPWTVEVCPLEVRGLEL